MYKNLMYFLVLFYLLILSLGIYLTVMTNFNKDTSDIPTWIKDNNKVLKWAGPTLVALSFIGLSLNIYIIYEMNNTSKSLSNFGFKFY
jgi:hypothetical protein